MNYKIEEIKNKLAIAKDHVKYLETKLKLASVKAFTEETGVMTNTILTDGKLTVITGKPHFFGNYFWYFDCKLIEDGKITDTNINVFIDDIKSDNWKIVQQ